jgi:hypothetical protein
MKIIIAQHVIRRSMGGGDFLKNPQGLNLLFCKPGTYLCYLFFYFLFFDSEHTFPMEVGFFSFGVGVVLQGFQILGLDKKPKSIKTLFIQNLNLKLLLHFLIFEGAWNNYE